jgi:hypothetical protein
MVNNPSFFSEQVFVHVIDTGRSMDILNLLGMHHVVSGSLMVTKQLLSPRPTPCGGHIKSRHAIWLRDLLPVIRNEPKHTLVIKRSGSRQILNHDDLIKALPGEVKVHTGHESMQEQMQLFADAKIVVAPHGAGLANIVAMSENNAVVELQVAPANHCYMFWAFNLGLYYYAHYEPGAVHNGKWSVNITKILSIPLFRQ